MWFDPWRVAPATGSLIYSPFIYTTNNNSTLKLIISRQLKRIYRLRSYNNLRPKIDTLHYLGERKSKLLLFSSCMLAWAMFASRRNKRFYQHAMHLAINITWPRVADYRRLKVYFTIRPFRQRTSVVIFYARRKLEALSSSKSHSFKSRHRDETFMFVF